MKVVYPDLVYGAIASSGVTYATIEDWQYYDIIRQFADSDCVKQIETAVSEFDDLASSPETVQTIKTFFGLPNVTHIQDVASLLAVCTFKLPSSDSPHQTYCCLQNPLGAWQDKNWDPAVNSDSFDNFCASLGTPSSETVEIARGVHVNNATAALAALVNRVRNVFPWQW